jgi:hypothetical protein
MKKYLAIFILIICTSAYADSQIQTNFVGAVEQSIPQWVDIATKTALKIYTILWCFETFTQIVFKNILGNDMKKLPTYLITRICLGGFFAYVMLKPDFYLGVIQFFGSLTTPMTIVNHKIQGFDAGWVLKQYHYWEDIVYIPAMRDVGKFAVGQAVSYAIMHVIYFICAHIIALIIIILEVQIYFTVFGAVVLTGFAGSSWTFSIWNRYLDAIIGLGVRVMVFGMLYGILSNQIAIDPRSLSATELLESTSTMVLTTACLYIIPSLIASMVSGSASGNSLGQAIGMGIAGVATAGYMAKNAISGVGSANKILKTKYGSKGGKGGGSSSGNSGGGSDSKPSNPMNNDSGANTPAPKKMPAGWKPADGVNSGDNNG